MPRHAPTRPSRIDSAQPLVCYPSSSRGLYSNLPSPSQSIRDSPPSCHHQPYRRKGKRRKGGEKKIEGEGDCTRGEAERRAWRRSCSSPTRPRRSQKPPPPHHESLPTSATSSSYPHRERHRLFFLSLGTLSGLHAAATIALPDRPSSRNHHSLSPWPPRVQGARTPRTAKGVSRARSSPAPCTHSRLAPALP